MEETNKELIEYDEDEEEGELEDGEEDD